jgi:diguanylate cyclase (GGDEF)-like protein
MAWALIIALAVVGVWWWRSRVEPQPRASLAAPDGDEAGGARPISRTSGERGVDSRTLFDAFRSDELPIPEEAERDDRILLVRMLGLLTEHLGAHEAVLWEPHEGEGGMLVASAWSRGVDPPALSESERLLLELAASEQRNTSNQGGEGLRFLCAGVPVNGGRGAVSVHFREEPAASKTDLAARLQRFAPEVAVRHELVKARATLAMRTKRLRAMIRTAITLQGSRDPIALEEVIVRDAGRVTGADWGFLVRGNRERELPAIVRVSDGVPGAFRERLTAHRDTLVGEVFYSGKHRVLTDARVLISSREAILDATPLPSGTRSLLAIPVRRSEAEPSIGVLVLGRERRNGFSITDSHAAQDLATIAAGALDTAWAWQDATLSAKTDQLTGLPNRRAFEEEFTRMIAETDRFGRESALVIVDVDHFKQVNDTYGHDAGDQVLKAIGATLSAMARTTDKVARLGGEELAMLLPQTDRQGALEAAERCRKAIEALSVRTNAGPVRVTASFGVAMYLERSGAAGALFDRADQALYSAKHGGRNRVILAP